MKAEEVFKLGLGGSVVYPNYTNGKHRHFKIRGYELGDEFVSLTDGRIQVRTHIDFIRPVPLTKDVLLKCGFKKVYHSDFRERWDLEKDFRFGFNKNHNAKNLPEGASFMGNVYSHVQHLHQLQNLYFSLTGEELNVKL